MSNADTRQDRSIDHEASRPSVDAPLVGDEWTEYRCRRCGEHCINRSDGAPSAGELCLDCFVLETDEAESNRGSEAGSNGNRGVAADEGESGSDGGASPLRSVRSSLASVAARFGRD